jgi:hypothetical protein
MFHEASPGQDLDDHLADLAEWGADPEAIDALREGAEAQLADSDDESDEPWPENQLPLRVFQHCKLPRTVAGSQMIYEEPAATEIRAACDLLDVPRAEWPRVIAGVRVCVSAVLPRLNTER